MLVCGSSFHHVVQPLEKNKFLAPYALQKSWIVSQLSYLWAVVIPIYINNYPIFFQ